MIKRRKDSGCFTPIQNTTQYKDSEKYRVLATTHGISNQSAGDLLYLEYSNIDYNTLYDALFDMLPFEDSGDLLLRKNTWANDFLLGEWKTGDGTKYFKVTNNDDGHTASTNLPKGELDNSHYTIKDGIYQLYNDSDTKDVFRFEVIDKNTINIYCFKDGSSYKMFRQ